MWLELVAEDKRGLVRLLGPRRQSTGVKLAITELGDAGLECEARFSHRFEEVYYSLHIINPDLTNGALRRDEVQIARRKAIAADRCQHPFQGVLRARPP